MKTMTRSYREEDLERYEHEFIYLNKKIRQHRKFIWNYNYKK